jgi:hypothetical protein
LVTSLRIIYMKRYCSAFLCLLVGILSWNALAGTVNVKGYTRKDGTYVAPHTRSSPGSGSTSPGLGSYSGSSTTPSKASESAPAVAETVVIPAPIKELSPDEKVALTNRVIAFEMENARKGLPSFQFSLGMRYLAGKGLSKDTQKGLDFLALAAIHGSTEAENQLLSLGKSHEDPSEREWIVQTVEDAEGKKTAVINGTKVEPGREICSALDTSRILQVKEVSDHTVTGQLDQKELILRVKPTQSDVVTK